MIYLFEEETNFQVYQKDREIAAKQIELNDVHNLNRILFILAIAFVLITIVIVLWLRSVRKVAGERKIEERINLCDHSLFINLTLRCKNF